ncbi:MAG: DUF1343 domain-containing protein [Clostridiales bacterium]|nr:DUF1343 domain-containing protein [Clostridiales bacterium]
MNPYNSGLERFIAKDYSLVKGKKVGLVTNHTGLSGDFKSNIDLFFEHPDINLVSLYAPEHGVRGNVADGVKVDNSIEQRKIACL